MRQCVRRCRHYSWTVRRMQTRALDAARVDAGKHWQARGGARGARIQLLNLSLIEPPFQSPHLVHRGAQAAKRLCRLQVQRRREVGDLAGLAEARKVERQHQLRAQHQLQLREQRPAALGDEETQQQLDEQHPAIVLCKGVIREVQRPAGGRCLRHGEPVGCSRGPSHREVRARGLHAAPPWRPPAVREGEARERRALCDELRRTGSLCWRSDAGSTRTRSSLLL